MNSANLRPAPGGYWVLSVDRNRTIGQPRFWKLSILSIWWTVLRLLASILFHFRFEASVKFVLMHLIVDS